MKHKLLDNAKKEIIIELNKVGKKENKRYLLAVARALDTSSRRFPCVNVYKLNKLSRKYKDKIFVVPGKVLGFGTVDNKIVVYAYSFSKRASEKIGAAKGTAKTLKDLVKDKVGGKNIMLVK